MAIAWNGGDPVEVVDSEDYELGVAYRADGDITITHARIWTGAGEENPATRRFRVWSSVGGTLLAMDLPADLAPGWSDHELATPLEVTSGTTFIPSFNTGGNYGALSGALDTDVVSGDGLVTALSAANAPGGNNGRFSETPGSFPSQGTPSHPFYGVTFRYDAGIGGNTPPTITQATAAAVGATVTATIVAADDEGLAGATYRIEWGDDSSPTLLTHPIASAQHTYSESGVYALLVRVTDSAGASDTVAVPVDVHVPDPAVSDLTQAQFAALMSRVVSHALASGWFEQVNGYEPESMPPHGLVAAAWIDRIDPLAGLSGLATVSYRLGLQVRIYSNGDQAPRDDIDPAITAATAALMKSYSGDFTLGDLVHEVDLLGAYGAPLAAQAGWLAFEDARLRVMTITVPLIVTDLWEQVA